MLGEVRGDVVLGNLACRTLSEQSGPCGAQAVAFGQQLLVRGKLVIEALQPLVYLGDDATSRRPITPREASATINLQDQEHDSSYTIRQVCQEIISYISCRR